LNEGKKKSGRNLDKRNVIRVRNKGNSMLYEDIFDLHRSQRGRCIVAHDIFHCAWEQVTGMERAAFVKSVGGKKKCTKP
jgi:hypothetical protein